MRKNHGLWVSALISWLMMGCMASNCPIKSCHVKKEHQHGGRTYRGTFFGTMHGPGWWLSNRKGGKGASASMASDRKGSKREKGDGKKKVKKQFRWERT
ncbi:hypothetical protein ACFQ4C_09295 [Larkinella insperata]|uniref:Secreted protein n=1 Tax=Larkinella insperata TaxID=332158 RepID=A0ABW3Q8G1_9BACT|nr:hypothetical protein [Larkinella insperata]